MQQYLTWATHRSFYCVQEKILLKRIYFRVFIYVYGLGEFNVYYFNSYWIVSKHCCSPYTSIAQTSRLFIAWSWTHLPRSSTHPLEENKHVVSFRHSHSGNEALSQWCRWEHLSFRFLLFPWPGRSPSFSPQPWPPPLTELPCPTEAMRGNTNPPTTLIMRHWDRW